MRLTKTELSYLGKKYKKTNPLALFSSIETALTGDEEKTLEEKEVLKGGNTTQQNDKLLNTIADPQRCTRLILKDGSYFIEKYAYRTGEEYALAENDDGEVIISPREHLDEALFQISQWVGMSDLKTFNLETTLLNDETVVLLAITDIQRERVLGSYLAEKGLDEISYIQIREHLENPAQGSLLRILTGNYKFAIPKAEETKEILDRLISKNIVAFQTGYSLLGDYVDFASSFLIPKSVIMLETFNLNEQNEISGAGVLCLWAGMKEIISIVFREGATEINSISGRQLLQMIEDFLNCPEVA